MHDNSNMNPIRDPPVPMLPGAGVKHGPIIKQSRPCWEDGSCWDDDFSDHDSHYSEDLNDLPYIFHDTCPDVTQQLLSFAELINADIQKYFGKKKGDEESCDIYEDKWVSDKSGRELYYADLLRMAQGDISETATKNDRGSIPPSRDDLDNRHRFSGIMDKKTGLGPLNELFEFGLRNFFLDKKIKSTKKLKRLRSDVKKHEDVVPMKQRKLPGSFWKEPGILSHVKQQDQQRHVATQSANYTLNSSKTPDFSDLLESWTGGEYSGELSSSDFSNSSSPESAIEQV